MPIRRAITLILLVTLMLPGVVAGFIALTVTLRNHAQLETSVMNERLQGLETDYTQQLDSLHASAIDWGQWDSAITFMDNPDDGEMRSWLVALDTYNNLHLSIATFVRPDLTLVFGAELDFQKQVVNEFTKNPDPTLTEVFRSVAPGANYGEDKSGVFIWKGAPYTFAAVPVLDVKRGQSGKGFLVLASKIDSDFWSRIAPGSALKVSSEVIPTTASSVPQRGTEIFSEVVKGVTTFPDADGKPRLKVSFSADRGLFRQASQMRWWFALALGVLGGVCMLSTFSLINRRVTKRVEALQRDAGAIALSGDFSLRVRGDESDEIGKLGTSVNAMLVSLENVHSEVVKARNEADKANRAKTSFISKVSHELRTPIFTMQGYLRILKKCELNPKATDCTGKITDSADSLLAVVNSILDFAELSSTAIQLQSCEFEPSEVLREVIAGHAAALRDKPDLVVTLRVSAALPSYITLDERRFTQICNHLLSNGIKFTDKGNVELTVEAAPTGINVVVRDTGVGMSAEQMSGGLEAFEQLEDTSNRRFDGLGLGLTLCRKILEAFGGKLSFEGAVGRGTVVTASIPLSYTPTGAAVDHMKVVYANKTTAHGAPEPQRQRPLRILIAEDVPLNQLVIKQMVEEMGHQAICVDNGLQMIDAISACLNGDGAEGSVAPFDIVLADLDMPGCNGVEAIRRTREAESRAGIPPENRIPILVVTANGSSSAANEARDAGSNGCVVKPVQPEQLANALRGVTGGGSTA